ncbi:MAG: GHKL domain-containing protein [Alistipes sp.]|nr:GHKL domain-containing protein [Alistipes sp.]
MPALLQQGANTGVFISLIIVMTASLIRVYAQTDLLLFIPVFTIIICGVLLFFWWKRSITQKYRRMLQKQETEALIYANQSLQKEIQTLRNDNEALSKIIHKDNKLIPAMELAVRELLASGQTSDHDADLKNRADSLLKELQLLTEERKGILLSYERDSLYTVSTGLTRFDALIHYMNQKCYLNGIDFKISLNTDIPQMTQEVIDEPDLCTLTADLLENAIIACKNQPVKNILLVIGIEDQHYFLNIFDSGVPFKLDTIQLIGKIRTTTHADTGGSGYGLITAFELARKYKASFYLEKNNDTPLYAKKISFCFDGLYIFTAYGERIIQ